MYSVVTFSFWKHLISIQKMTNDCTVFLLSLLLEDGTGFFLLVLQISEFLTLKVLPSQACYLASCLTQVRNLANRRRRRKEACWLLQVPLSNGIWFVSASTVQENFTLLFWLCSPSSHTILILRKCPVVEISLAFCQISFFLASPGVHQNLL